MRVLTWNVNGIRTLLSYSPWNVDKSYENILTDLGADITCFQETKIKPSHIDRNMACLDNYDAFFSSFCRKAEGQGIHGTCIYTKRSTVIPIKAEEGLSSHLLKADTPLAQRIGGYPTVVDTDLTVGEIKDVDLEGRTTVVDVGMFVVITVYCPHAGEEGPRNEFKQKFNTMLEERVKGLIRLGREVIVLGDINVSHSDDILKVPENSISRVWFRKLIDKETGILVDITRKMHPTRLDMFTFWETKIDARANNMGARIDYILLTPGLIPWVAHSDIMPEIKGSDHCPVYVDFHDTLEIEGRGTVSIWDEMNPGRSRNGDPPVAPPLAIRHADDFSGKQPSLASWFGPKSSTPKPRATSTESPAPTAGDAVASPLASSSAPASIPTRKRLSERSLGESLALMAARTAEPVTPAAGKKGKGKEKEKDNKQQKLAFFKPAVAKEDKPKKAKKAKTAEATQSLDLTRESRSPSVSLAVTSTQTAASADDDPPSLDDCELAESGSVNRSALAAWQEILTPRAIPLCEGHNEPATSYRVGKPGPTHGRYFWVCSRKVGEGYDQGQPKLYVNPIYKCRFFLWDSDRRGK